MGHKNTQFVITCAFSSPTNLVQNAYMCKAVGGTVHVGGFMGTGTKCVYPGGIKQPLSCLQTL